MFNYVCELIEKKRKNSKPYKVIKKCKTEEEAKNYIKELRTLNKSIPYFTCNEEFIN